MDRAFNDTEDSTPQVIRQKFENADDPLWDIINTTAEGIITIDEQGRIETFNPAAEAIFGYAAGEVLGQDVSILIPESDRGAHQHCVEQSALFTPRIMDKGTDLFGRRKDGSLFHIALNIAPIGSNKKRFVGFVRDVTEQKIHEHQLENAKQRAESANIARSTFMSSMSHEFRTPLNAIIGFGEMLDHGHPVALKPEQADYISHILSSAQYLLNLVSDVLEMSQIESGKLNLESEPCTIKTWADEALKIVSPRAKKFNIDLTNTCPTDLAVMADPQRFLQIFINLLSNAIKYNKMNGAVTVSCEKIEHDAVRIYIADSGCGIPLDKHSQAFEPFNRLGREAGTIEGTGVGLTITKDLVEIMGGKIDFHSTAEEGTTFWFDLPLASSSTKLHQNTRTKHATNGQRVVF